MVILTDLTYKTVWCKKYLNLYVKLLLNIIKYASYMINLHCHSHRLAYTITSYALSDIAPL